MKILQKATLAAAIAAAPFLAANAMQPLTDDVLSEMTGQAGVTIETEVAGKNATTIGSILYTDTGSGATGGGSVSIQGNGAFADGNGIAVSGVKLDAAAAAIATEGVGGLNNYTQAQVDLAEKGYVYAGSHTRQTVDIDENGNLVTKTVAIDGFGGGEITSTAKMIQIGQVLLQSDTQKGTANGAQLASNLTMIQESGKSYAHILNLSDGQYDLTSGNAASVEHTIDGKAISLNNLKGQGANIAIVTKGSSRIANLSVDALDGAVGVRDMSYGGGPNGTDLMESTQVIWAVAGEAVAGDNTKLGGVYIQGSDSVGTLRIGSLELGQASIGSIQIKDLSQSGSITRIYGH